MSETSFTDKDGDIYRVERYGKGEYTLIEMYYNSKMEIAFLATDAAKIIHLIAEAAAVKPTWDDVNAQLNSLLRPADADEPTEDMGQ